MMIDRRTFGISLAATGLLSALSRPGVALATDAFPSRPITFVVPFPAGSGTDGVARVVGDGLRSGLGQAVTVENKAGADGTVAARSVASAKPDGYTILIGGNSTHSAAANLFSTLPYDPLKDLMPVAGLMTIPLMLAVAPGFPATDTASFLAEARRSSRRLSFASSNTSSRAAAELLKARAGIEALHVPYRGSPQALTDLIGGRIDFFFVDPSAASGMVQEGTIKALAVTSGVRLPQFPAIPTIAEAAALPDYELVAWIAAFAPAGTPGSVVDRLNREIGAVLRSPDAAEYFRKVGGQPFALGPEELGEFAARDVRKWAEIVKLGKMERR